MVTCRIFVRFKSHLKKLSFVGRLKQHDDTSTYMSMIKDLLHELSSLSESRKQRAKMWYERCMFRRYAAIKASPSLHVEGYINYKCGARAIMLVNIISALAITHFGLILLCFYLTGRYTVMFHLTALG